MLGRPPPPFANASVSFSSGARRAQRTSRALIARGSQAGPSEPSGPTAVHAGCEEFPNDVSRTSMGSAHKTKGLAALKQPSARDTRALDRRTKSRNHSGRARNALRDYLALPRGPSGLRGLSFAHQSATLMQQSLRASTLRSPADLMRKRRAREKPSGQSRAPYCAPGREGERAGVLPSLRSVRPPPLFANASVSFLAGARRARRTSRALVARGLQARRAQPAE